MVEKSAIVQAIKAALQDSPERKFSQSVELAFNLKNIDLTIPKNRVDEEVILPKGRGKEATVGFFASGELAMKAKAVAQLVIQPDQLEEFAGNKRTARKEVNKINFFVSEAPLMPTIGRTLGTVLGPRGKMPRPVPPNADPVPLVNNLKNSIRVRSRDRRTFHAMIGTATMTPEDLADNAGLIIQRITAKLERGEQNFDSIFVKTTMGPAKRVL